MLVVTIRAGLFEKHVDPAAFKRKKYSFRVVELTPTDAWLQVPASDSGIQKKKSITTSN